jgi:DNA-binding NarL/FixJ family response regulator
MLTLDGAESSFRGTMAPGVARSQNDSDELVFVHSHIQKQMEPNTLSDKSRAILEAIAKGHTYEQILVQDLAWTYHDIFQAAAEALELAEFAGTKKSYDERLTEIKQAYPKAYQAWSKEEDVRLAERFHAGVSVKELAREFQRQPSAIRSRLAKLNLGAPK